MDEPDLHAAVARALRFARNGTHVGHPLDFTQCGILGADLQAANLAQARRALEALEQMGWKIASVV